MDLLSFDFASATLATLAVLGVVNVITIFSPDMDSRLKFTLSVVAALLVGLIPADLGNIIATHIKDALVVAFAASGVYKVAQQSGGKPSK